MYLWSFLLCFSLSVLLHEFISFIHFSVPINQELRRLLATFQTQNQQLKGEVQRYRRKFKESQVEIQKVKCDMASDLYSVELFKLNQVLLFVKQISVVSRTQPSCSWPRESHLLQWHPLSIDVNRATWSMMRFVIVLISVLINISF